VKSKYLYVIAGIIIFLISISFMLAATNQPIPGQIEAESYSAMSGIQTETCSEGGLDVAWTDAGDWMDYSLNVQNTGTYTVDFRVASPYANTQFQLKNGSTILATMTVPNTGGWQTYSTVTASNISLTAGQNQTLRVYAVTNGWSLNWLKFNLGGAATPTSTKTPTPTKTPSNIIPTPTPTRTPTFPGVQVNIDATNNTGQTANDLDVIFKGNVTVLGYAFWGSNPFQSLSVAYNPNNTTTARWYNGTVANGESIHFCIYISSNCADYSYVTQWTLNQKPIGNIGTTLSQGFQGVAPGMVNMTIANNTLDGGPTTLESIEVGTTNTGFSLQTLFWYNLNQNVVWTINQSGIHLNNGESKSFSITVPSGAVGIVYRIKTHPDGLNEDANYVNYIGQFSPFINWAPNVSYSVGSYVSYNGIYYICIQAHISHTGLEPPNAPSYWQPLYGLTH
jgi:hypothetical protein